MAVIWSPVFDWDNGDWREQAACRRTDPDLFFPAGTVEAAEQIAAAKAVCRSCPVQGPCLRFAVYTNQEAGIWGGLDEVERRRLRRKRVISRRTPSPPT